MLQTFTLKNRIKVATYNMPNLRSMKLMLVAKAGSIFDTPNTSGIAHFTEHMLVQGTTSFPTAESMSSYLESLAANYNASTRRYSMTFGINLPAIHKEVAVKVASEVFFAPLFPDKAFKKERQAIIEELSQDESSTHYRLGKYIRETTFKSNSPLTLNAGGETTAIKKLTKADLN